MAGPAGGGGRGGGLLRRSASFSLSSAPPAPLLVLPRRLFRARQRSLTASTLFHPHHFLSLFHFPTLISLFVRRTVVPFLDFSALLSASPVCRFSASH